MTTESSMDVPTQIRQSCKELLDHTNCAVTINAEKVDSFLDNLDWAQYEDLSRTQRFPLNFSSIEDEINFIVLHGLLQFGSGYRKELHKLCDRGASDTIVSGLLGMFISGKKLDAAFLKQLSIDSISAYFNIPLDEEEKVSTGIYASKPGPLRPLAQMIQQVLVESGDILEKRKDDNFGAFVMNNLKPNGSDNSPSAKYLLQQLITTFPAFDDHRECHGNDVYLYKRAQLTVNSIHDRFSEPNPELSFEDIDELTVTSDNVLPCVLHALDILKYTPELQQTIDDGKELEAGTFECEVRAGAIFACDLIVAKSNGKLSTRGLGTYLWRLGSKATLGSISTFVSKEKSEPVVETVRDWPSPATPELVLTANTSTGLVLNMAPMSVKHAPGSDDEDNDERLAPPLLPKIVDRLRTESMDTPTGRHRMSICSTSGTPYESVAVVGHVCGKDNVVYYLIEVRAFEMPLDDYVVRRRYSDFKRFYAKLARVMPSASTGRTSNQVQPGLAASAMEAIGIYGSSLLCTTPTPEHSPMWSPVTSPLRQTPRPSRGVMGTGSYDAQEHEKRKHNQDESSSSDEYEIRNSAPAAFDVRGAMSPYNGYKGSHEHRGRAYYCSKDTELPLDDVTLTAEGKPCLPALPSAGVTSYFSTRHALVESRIEQFNHILAAVLSDDSIEVAEYLKEFIQEKPGNQRTYVTLADYAAVEMPFSVERHARRRAMSISKKGVAHEGSEPEQV